METPVKLVVVVAVEAVVAVVVVEVVEVVEVVVPLELVGDGLVEGLPWAHLS